MGAGWRSSTRCAQGDSARRLVRAAGRTFRLPLLCKPGEAKADVKSSYVGAATQFRVVTAKDGVGSRDGPFGNFRFPSMMFADTWALGTSSVNATVSSAATNSGMCAISMISGPRFQVLLTPPSDRSRIGRSTSACLLPMGPYTSRHWKTAVVAASVPQRDKSWVVVPIR